ncbi:hypothetical protein GOZ97_21905 [Agrobacterium vitis]|uniref:hypothetical protein n=1 Tax=Rhizobium/Agrobacterium group TaxID=227290 RepID=UPI0012E97A9A|nr:MULTISPECIES: hypothetical protein [Rhizobium/Agrobacterium group]MUO88909.1 hypothetical protein [Agrobacterium vitis]MUZ53348.1 hypothetical protein [Agrobacterium vitis]MUZ94080.1 hypothetical protein [Agrobacterium vitis]MVA42080.1 hypothetical protein [Agrobacterium vitis]NSX99336.1 hypothetical protein [Agrobacterium vitis]
MEPFLKACATAPKIEAARKDSKHLILNEKFFTGWGMTGADLAPSRLHFYSVN